MRTVGVEEELLLIDSMGSAVPRGETMASDGVADVEHEFKLEQTEIQTDPCSALAELRAQLITARQQADLAARRAGGRVAAIGTSPLPVAPHDTPDERYRRMAESFGELAVTQLTCGQHVHVSVASRAEGVAVLDRIRDWLPLLRALSANSPFWQGADSGYASYRTVQWGHWPTAGPAAVFGDESAYDREVHALIDSGAALDTGMIYFDARLSDAFPTGEVRVADVCTSVDEATAIATLCRALVETAAREWKAGVAPFGNSQGVLRAWSWRAARYGTAGDLVDPAHRTVVDAWTAIDTLMAHVREALDAADDTVFVEQALHRIRRTGTGAARQRAASEGMSLRRMVLDAADRTLAS